jgi:hypothetical protein
MIAKLSNLLTKWPSEKMLVVACVVGLGALGLMALSIVFPAPILVVASMSLAQGLGAAALLLYVASVAAEYRRDTGSAMFDDLGKQGQPPEKP